MEKIDWNRYKGRDVSFIDPQNTDAGYQYNAELIGIDPALIEGMENVQIRDSAGSVILIPIELASTCIRIHSDGPSSDLDD